MIDVNKDKLITISFPAGSGGHFILASLALSDQCIPMSKKFLKNSLNKDLILDSFLVNFKKSVATKKWQDFGIEIDIELLEDPSSEDLPASLSNKDVYLLGMITANEHYPLLRETWKNLTIIHFINCAEFGQWRANNVNYKINDLWQNIRGHDWPVEAPKSAEELQSYSLAIRQELTNKFNNTIMNYFNLNEFDIDSQFRNEFIPYTKLDPTLAEYSINYAENQKLIPWNCQNFFSKDNTVNSIEKLYDELGLTNFNRSAVTTLYQEWIHALRVLNNIRIA
jgi:hypothetical protein